MKFKLIRTDSDAPSKIQLEDGTQIFGRGKLLDCHDHRVSRKHGQLEVSEGSLILTALHQNPCFYIKAGTVETQVLKQNCSERLVNEDKFGVLPGSYWYEVLQCQTEDEGNIQDNVSMTDTEPLTDKEDDVSEERSKQTTCGNAEESCANENTDADTLVTPCSTDNNEVTDKQSCTKDKNDHNVADPNCDDSMPIEFNIDETNHNVEQPGSPSLITGNNQSNDASAQESTSDQSPQKRTHSTDNDETSDVPKRIKTEPEDDYNVQDVKPDVNAAGPSNSDDMNIVNQPAPQVLNRERCIYGAQCYRRNPQHLAQFAHPADADWGAGARAACPYGAACRRRDPRHWRGHVHPPAARAPPAAAAAAPRPGKQVVYRYGNIFYINAHTVNFYDDHFEAEDSDGCSVDYDYEF